MAAPSFQKFYFLAPTRNYTPGKRIKLGSILPGPHEPDYPLNEVAVVVDPSQIDQHNEYQWSAEYGADNSINVGIFTSFLKSILSVGLDASAGVATQGTLKLDCKKITVEEFSPSRAFIDKCIKDAGVQSAYKQRKRFQKTINVYMITGVKVAIGASSVADLAQQKNIHLHAAADGTPLQVPAEGGVKVDVERQKSQGESFKKADAFVLGFRLRRIQIGAKGVMKVDDYTDGAVHGEGDDEDEDEDGAEAEVEEVGDVDVRGQDFGLAEDTLQDAATGETYLCGHTG